MLSATEAIGRGTYAIDLLMPGDISLLPTRRLNPSSVNGRQDSAYSSNELVTVSERDTEKIDLIFKYITLHGKIAYFIGLLSGGLEDYKSGNPEYLANARAIIEQEQVAEFYASAVQPGYSTEGMSRKEFFDRVYNDPTTFTDQLAKEALTILVQGNSAELSEEKKRLIDETVRVSDIMMTQIMPAKLEGKTGVFLRDRYTDGKEKYVDPRQIASLLYWLKEYLDEKLPPSVRGRDRVHQYNEADLTIFSRYWSRIPLRDLPFVFDWTHNLGILHELRDNWENRREDPLRALGINCAD